MLRSGSGTWSRNSCHSAGKNRPAWTVSQSMSSAVPVLTPPTHDGGHAVRMAFGVRQPQHRSPRQPEDDPALDVEVLAQPLDVGDVVVHVDARPVHVLLAGVRCAAPGRPLIEQHGAMPLCVEAAASPGSATTAGAAVEVDDRGALRVTDLLDVEDVAVADVELAGGERFGRWGGHPAQVGAVAASGNQFASGASRLAVALPGTHRSVPAAQIGRDATAVASFARQCRRNHPSSSRTARR